MELQGTTSGKSGQLLRPQHQHVPVTNPSWHYGYVRVQGKMSVVWMRLVTYTSRMLAGRMLLMMKRMSIVGVAVTIKWLGMIIWLSSYQ